MLQSTFSLKELLLGSEEWIFLLETLFRTIIMFTVILVSLSTLGKRGVKQLSVFELVVIIGLGSAAGDPMFYKDVGLLPAMIVFFLVTTLYITITHLVSKHKKVERLIEGRPVCLIEDGKFAIHNFEKEPLGQDEFFAELRLQGVSHLGQVEKAIIETNGGISVFFYEDRNVRFGLPIMPDTLEKQVQEISKSGTYACIFCGRTEQLEPAPKHICPTCQKDLWVPAIDRKRIR